MQVQSHNTQAITKSPSVRVASSFRCTAVPARAVFVACQPGPKGALSPRTPSPAVKNCIVSPRSFCFNYTPTFLKMRKYTRQTEVVNLSQKILENSIYTQSSSSRISEEPELHTSPVLISLRPPTPPRLPQSPFCSYLLLCPRVPRSLESVDLGERPLFTLPNTAWSPLCKHHSFRPSGTSVMQALPSPPIIV